MASQTTPDGHFSSVLGMQLSDWSTEQFSLAGNWNVGYWVSTWGFGQSLRTDWPLHLFPFCISALSHSCYLLVRTCSQLWHGPYLGCVSLPLTVAKAAKLFNLKSYVDSAVSDNNCLLCLRISANCLEWSTLNLSVKPTKPHVSGFTLFSWGHSH